VNNLVLLKNYRKTQTLNPQFEEIVTKTMSYDLPAKLHMMLLLKIVTHLVKSIAKYVRMNPKDSEFFANNINDLPRIYVIESEKKWKSKL
jgi:hypothetical protein